MNFLNRQGRRFPPTILISIAGYNIYRLGYLAFGYETAHEFYSHLADLQVSELRVAAQRSALMSFIRIICAAQRLYDKYEKVSFSNISDVVFTFKDWIYKVSLITKCVIKLTPSRFKYTSVIIINGNYFVVVLSLVNLIHRKDMANNIKDD